MGQSKQKTKKRSNSQKKALHRRHNRMSSKNKNRSGNIINITDATKHVQEEKMPLKKRLLIDISAAVIAIVLLLVIFMIIGHYKVQNIGFTEKDELIRTYFEGLNDADRGKMEKCFYPYTKDTNTNLDTQLQYAESESEQTVWNPEKISIEWEDTDVQTLQKNIQENIGNIAIDDAAQCVAMVPLEQKSNDNIKVQEEDVYQFYVYKANDRWYIAAFMQTSRNITGAIREDGTAMTNEEVEEWLYSLALEIGNDKVGYLFVDNYWQEIVDEKYADDEQIKTYITVDYSSYLTIAAVKDTDVTDFNEYAANIINESEQDYGDIMTGDGLVSEYPATVQIAQNEETGAKIIIWIFKTSDTDEYTHVITLEATSDYDASTYINTFHLTRQHPIDSTEE